MDYSLLKNIGLDPHLSQYTTCDNDLPVITLTGDSLNHDSELTSLSTLFHKTNHISHFNRSLQQPYPEENIIESQEHVKTQENFAENKRYEMTCIDVYDHIESCRVCSQLHNKNHSHHTSCDHTHQEIKNTTENTKNYKSICIILICVCIILFAMLLKILIGKDK